MPAAAAAWAAAVVVVVLDARAAAVAGVLVGAAPALAVTRRSGRQTRAPETRSTRAPSLSDGPPGHRQPAGPMSTALLAATCAAAVLLAGASQLVVREAGALPSLVHDRATVRLEGRVRSEPVRLRGPGERVRTVVAVDVVERRGMASAVAVPVEVTGGAAWAAVPFGTRVAVAGRLAPDDRGSPTAARLAGGDPVVLQRAPPRDRWPARMRAALRDAVDPLAPDARGLVPGIAVGDTSALPDDLAAAMRTAGLTHTTAVSGAHFAILGAAVLALCAWARAPIPVRAGALLAATLGFVALVHPQPSVLRAAVMAGVAVLALVLGRPAQALPALAVAVVVLLVADPWLARQYGFVLSVLATAGLVLLSGPLAARLPERVPEPLARALAAPVAAQAACGPVVVLLSPSVTTYAVAANVAAAPAVAPATVFGVLAAVVGPWWPGAAEVLARIAGLATWWIARVARVAADLPGAQLPWADGAGGAALLALGTAAALGLLLHRRPRDG